MRFAISPLIVQLRALPNLVRQLWVRDYQDVKLIIEQSGDLRYFNIPARIQRVFARGTIVLSSVTVCSLLFLSVTSLLLGISRARLERSHEEVFRAVAPPNLSRI
jgi:hypothetical protein